MSQLLSDVIKSDCFIISAKCNECGAEAELKKDHRGYFLVCSECGEDYIDLNFIGVDKN